MFLEVSDLRRELADAPAYDTASAGLAQARVDQILRPGGATARLDDLAVWLAGWQNTPAPTVERPGAIIFAGDHGVVTEGVSAYPAEVTQAMLDAFGKEQGSINALARVAGATVTAIDVGVGQPTGNIRVEPAMASERLANCFAAGRSAVDATDADLLIFGEMGIGNTTSAAALTSHYLGVKAAEVTGPGTGIDAEALANKQRVVDDAVARAGALADPIAAWSELGGTEIVALAGAMFEARLRSIPVLLDGFIVGSAALAVHAIDPTATANCWAGHCSAEPGHRMILDHLGLDPLLTLGLRLGEASGAMAALPLVRAACALLTEVPTFEEWFGPAPA